MTFKFLQPSKKEAKRVIILGSTGIISKNLQKKLKKKSINFSKSTFEALKGAKVLFIMAPWKEFKNLSAQVIKKFMKGNIIIDPYRVLNQKKLSKFKFIYLSI